METGLPADDGAGTGIPAGTGMQTGLSRTSPPVILNFPHVILSEAKDLLSPAARQRNGEKILRRLRLLRMTGRNPAYLQTEVQELSLLRAAAWAWICRPFPGGGTICWAEPAPACRKKKVTGKSGFTEFRPPQPPGCNPQIIAKGNPMWEGRKKQKFCHFRGHAPGK